MASIKYCLAKLRMKVKAIYRAADILRVVFGGRKLIMSSTPKPILKKLQKQPSTGASDPTRTKELCEELSKLKPFLFYGNITPDVLRSLASEGIREAHEARTVLWLQDECIDKFYCILRGSVTAYVDTESEISCLDATNATLSAGAGNAKVLKQSGNRKRLRGYGLEANVIRPGQCFGEMCCLSVSDVAKSPFTFVTSQYSEILSLNKSAFQSLLQEYFVSCVMERASFLVSHYPMIRSWEIQCLSRLCSVLHERTYSLGEVVATQGSPISSIYFVKEGLLKLSIDPEKINLLEIRSKIRPPTGLLAQILKLETPHKTAVVKKPKGVPLQRKERDLQGERESVLRRYRLKQPNLLREMPICVLTNGGIVNGIEALCDLRHQLFTICAESNNLVLYCINTVHFSSLFCSLCPEEMIAHLLDHLLHWRERFPCLQMFECLRLLFEQQLVELERKRLMHDEGISSRCHHHRHALHHPEILPKLVKDFICR